jgi:hypothetical protein
MLCLLLKCYYVLLLCLLKYAYYPVGLEYPMRLGDGQNIRPAHGDGDGDGFVIFSWGWVWEGKTRWVSSPLPS